MDPYAPLVAYMADHWSRSSTWQDTVARGVGLMWDFFRAHDVDDVDLIDERPGLKRMFRAFALNLVTGTIDLETAYDPLGLYWPSMPRARALTLLRSIEDFLRWYQVEWLDRPEMRRASAFGQALPRDALTFTDVLVWSRLRQVSALAHLKSPQKVRREGRYDVGREPKGMSVKPAKFFPPDRVEALVIEGHKRPIGRDMQPTNVRDQMIALLCAFGGLRRSEALHLWVNDVTLDPARPGCALVVLHHPSEAKFTYVDGGGSELTVTRKEYLAREFGLEPRHLVMRGRYHAGWKGMEMDADARAVVHWLDEDAGRVFWFLYGVYVQDRRRIMNLRKESLAREPACGDHPFLFVSQGSSRQKGRKKSTGDPYSTQAYERNHRAAVKRLGLPYGKRHGTTTHGLRHAYGQALMRLGLAAPVIQKSLRHRHALSQVVYVAPDDAEVARALKAATKKMRGEGQTSFDLPGSETSLALYALSRHITSGGPRG